MDYQKGKIYKIESQLGDKIYIGSTTKEYLSQRMTAHRKSYTQWKRTGIKRKVYSYELFDEYGVENCQIVLLESYPCNSKDELSAKEAHYIRTLKCVNKCVPLRTKKEYRQECKDKIKQYNDDHRINRLAYYEQNIDIIKEKKKKYYEDNKVRLQEYKKQWYLKKKAQQSS
jgi:hypothetical protein